MFALNSQEFEIQTEMALFLKHGHSALENIVSEGWGIYPEILNMLVALHYENHIDSLLSAVKHERYPLGPMRDWMEAYYGENWKQFVNRFKFNRIAEAYLSISDCEKLGMSRAIAAKSRKWQIMMDTQGIDAVKNRYMSLRGKLHQGSPRDEFDQVYEIERFLLTQKEYEYLYNKEAWKTLCSSLDGCKYIAEVRHYMNKLASCLMEYYQTMSQEARKYCVDQLDRASLDDNYRPRYKEWRFQHVF